MPMRPKYCTQCGQPVAVREIAGRSRAVCDSCGTVFYENPVPIAAAVVFNDRREVLMVQRRKPPHAGEWCLPMGFAEVGETIMTAALRELHEETGVTGRIVRLLDADSFGVDPYGELLCVTFEIEKTGGEEVAGDDAAAVRYFPLGLHPPLAFATNERALRRCAALHLPAWEIADSFAALQHDEDRVLLSDELVTWLESHAAEVTDAWLSEVRANPTTAGYREYPVDLVRQSAARLLSHFGHFLADEHAAAEVATFCRDLAAHRRDTGVPLHEVLSSLMLLKKKVWQAAQSQGPWQRPIDVYRLLEFNRRTAVFFDKAVYHTARAFETTPSC